MRFVGQATSEWLSYNEDRSTREGGDGRYWHAPDDMSSEVETGDFLYGLVRAIKPAVAIETGCHKGATTLYMARAIKNNSYGNLYCCDTNPEHCAHVRELLSGWPLDIGSAEVHNCAGRELISRFPEIDLAFIDSGDDETRFQECWALRHRLSSDGIVILHDAHRSTYAKVKAELGWQAIKLFTPRGLAIFANPA